jgi:hypothetical protein
MIAFEMVAHNLHIPHEPLAAICEKYRARRLSVFGSVLTDRFGPDSDVDMLVEFEPDAGVTYLDLVAMEMELSDLIGRKVDLRTPAELSRYFRERVLQEAQVQYAA